MAKEKATVDWGHTRGSLEAPTYAVLLHGLDSSPTTLDAVAKTVEDELAPCYVEVPKLPLDWHSCVELRELAREIRSHVTGLINANPRFERIVLIGHSVGGVLAQAVYLVARQPKEAGQADHSDELFAHARLVLIAPLNRGWALSHHLPLRKKLAWAVGLAMLPLVKAREGLKGVLALRWPREPWILQVRKGAPFLVWLRLSWLELHRRLPGQRHDVVQLLGSVDELVSWRDMVDPATGGSFAHLEVPQSDHVAIIDFEDSDHSAAAEGRREIFRVALGGIEKASDSPWVVEPWDEDPLPPNPKVRRVVFVIHGIRDEGHWTQKIATYARREYAAQHGPGSLDEIEVVTSSYGYFSLVQFLRFGQRREKVDWLIEEYVKAKRRFPHAELSFIGHSNGTYLAAHALDRFPEVSFQRLAFAGSVVSSKFDWSGLVAAGRVTDVLNYAATTDWVVAFFPRLAELFARPWLFGPNLGGAGILGFDQRGSATTLSYRKGQHGAAIVEENWPQLARFAVREPVEYPGRPADLYEDDPVPAFGEVWGATTSVLIWALVLAVALGGLPLIAWTWPFYFWLAPLPLLAGVVVSITIAEERSGRVELRLRNRVRKRWRRALLVLTAVIYALLFAFSGLGGMLTLWNEVSGEGIRTLSLLGCYSATFRLLTRV